MDRSRANWPPPLLVVIMMLCAASAQAQFGSLQSRAHAPQAKSQEELDAYLQVVTESSPQSVVRDVETFVAQFAGSELAGTAYQYQMRAYEQMGDFAAMLRAGQTALQLQPNNLSTLTVLAPAIANHMLQAPLEHQLPDLAEQYSRLILQSVEKTVPPRQTPLAEWMKEKRTMQTGAHEVLGLVALTRRQTDVAIREFQSAIELSRVPDGSLYLRLGLAYTEAGNETEARKRFQQAIEYGPDDVRHLAADLLNKPRKANP